MCKRLLEFTEWLQLRLTSSDQVEERTWIFFYYLLCLQGDVWRKPPATNSPVSIRPLALFICCEVLLNVAFTNFTTQRVETASQRTVIWNLSLVLHRHWCFMECWLSQASSFFQISIEVKFPSERKRAKLKSLPHKSGANEITTGSLHPLASNMQLRDSRHRFERLPQQKLQGFQHRCGIHQHPGTRGYARGRG